MARENLSELNQHRLRKRLANDSDYDDDHNNNDDYDQTEDGGHNRRIYRRSTRLTSLEQEHKNENNDISEKQGYDSSNNIITTLRPTDLRPRYGQKSPYICGFCMRHWEKELRSVFIPELEIIRAKQKKGHDDRERRKQRKLEKQRLEEMTKSNEDYYNTTIPSNSSMTGQGQGQRQEPSASTNTSTTTTTNIISNDEPMPSANTVTTPQRTLGIDVNPTVPSTNTNSTTTTSLTPHNV